MNDLAGYYYYLKPFIPRHLQILIRRLVALRKRRASGNFWPILESAGIPPEGWQGWPGGKQFAFVLTHDVESDNGQEKCSKLIDLELQHGFCSSFYFVAEKYPINQGLLSLIQDKGFEIGVHGLSHDRTLFQSRQMFLRQTPRINRYLREWGAVGFRAPCMYHNLDWMHELEIEYDSSTFDTDPFEPQPDGMGTIFPRYISGSSEQSGYTELPYTLPQDFTLYVLFREQNIDVWKQKLDWVAENGGMVLLNTHPDYMNFNTAKSAYDEYPVRIYREFLEYVKEKYSGHYWHALPRDMAEYWKETTVMNPVSEKEHAYADRWKKTYASPLYEGALS